MTSATPLAIADMAAPDALLPAPLPIAEAVSGGPQALLVLAIAVPMLLALAMLVPALRRFIPRLLVLAPLPALIAAASVPRGLTVLVAPYPFRVTLALDGPGALLLGGSALLWMAAGAYATSYMRKDAKRDAFAEWWLLTMAGSFAVFLVADVASFYLAYALVSFSAFGLVAHDDTAQARRAGNVYLALTVLGEALLIAAFVMLASGASAANPLIRDAVAGLADSPFQAPILLLLLVGFALKMGVFPLHVWMPLAHSVAPVPGSAALSGVVVKAGVIGLIRFLPQETALPGWGDALLAAGLFTAFYGVAIGVTQRHPKRALAYSTVSQMGVVAAVIGAAMESGVPGAFPIAAFYAVNHMLLKGAMFLLAGLAMASDPRRAHAVALLALLVGLSLAGLPLTGGALAKYAIKLVIPDGVAGFLLTLSAAGSTLLMAHYALLVARSGKTAEAPPLTLVGPAALLAAVALATPYLMFETVTGLPSSAAFSSDALVKALWPIALGGAAAVILLRHARALPEIPAGDILIAAGGLREAGGWILDKAVLADALLRRWPIACGALLVVATLLAVVQISILE